MPMRGPNGNDLFDDTLYGAYSNAYVKEHDDPLALEEAKYFGKTTADDWRADPYYDKKYRDAMSGLYGAAGDMGGSAADMGRVAGEFEDIYAAGGLDDIARAENEMMRRRYLQDEKSQRDALAQRMDERGLGGSGAELAGQLYGQQSSANAQYLASLQNLASGQARAHNALGQAGQLYGQQGQLYGQQAGAYGGMGQGALAGRGQSFAESATRGAAKDAMSQYNVGYQRDVERDNTNRKNAERWAKANMRFQHAQLNKGVKPYSDTDEQKADLYGY